MLTGCGAPAAAAKPAPTAPVAAVRRPIAQHVSSRTMVTRQGSSSPAPRVSGPPLRIAIWGDSLTAQSADYLRFFFTLSHKANLMVVAFGGAALCDWLPDMRSETDPLNGAGFHPQVAIVALSVSDLTPCMRQVAQQGTEQALVDKYAVDSAIAVSIFQRRHIPVYFVAPPLWRHDAELGRVGRTPIGWMYSTLPARYPAGHLVRFVDAGAALEWHGHYSDTLPCRKWERCTGHWPDGTPTVVVRQADGGHFCPVQEVPIPGGNGAVECPSYMGGASRFAQAIAQPVLRDFGAN